MTNRSLLGRRCPLNHPGLMILTLVRPSLRINSSELQDFIPDWSCRQGQAVQSGACRGPRYLVRLGVAPFLTMGISVEKHNARISHPLTRSLRHNMCRPTLVPLQPNLNAASWANSSPKPSIIPLMNGKTRFMAAPRMSDQSVGG